MRIGMYDPGHVAEWLRLMNLVRPVPINLPEFEAREAVCGFGDSGFGDSALNYSVSLKGCIPKALSPQC